MKGLGPVSVLYTELVVDQFNTGSCRSQGYQRSGRGPYGSVHFLERVPFLQTTTSHDFAPESGLQPPAVSEPNFAPTAIDDENAPKPLQKKRNVGTSPVRRTTNTQTEPSSLEEVAPRHPSVGYENKSDFVSSPVEAIHDLLWAQSCFSLISFTDSRDRLTLPLAEPFYAACIPAFHRTHIFVF